MPTSSPKAITDVLECISALAPRSILDVGCGWGQYGFLFRFHLDNGRWCERMNGALAGPSNLQIDTIEPYKPNLTEVHERLYDRIFVGDVRDEMDRMQDYDVIFLGGVIEHFEKDEGLALLRRLSQKANKGVVVLTPLGFAPQGAVGGNEGERHKSGWFPADFRAFPHTQVVLIGNVAGDLRVLAVICRSEALRREVRWLYHPARCLLRQVCLSAFGTARGTKLFIAVSGLRNLLKPSGSEEPRRRTAAD